MRCGCGLEKSLVYSVLWSHFNVFVETGKEGELHWYLSFFLVAVKCQIDHNLLPELRRHSNGT